MKSGFVNIVGNPNVGKSTLSNSLVGERLSIITSKAQTTRKRIMGIVNGDDYQVVFSDTPGVLKPNYRLQETMLDYSKEALRDADVLIYVTDVVEKPDKYDDFLMCKYVYEGDEDFQNAKAWAIDQYGAESVNAILDAIPTEC